MKQGKSNQGNLNIQGQSNYENLNIQMEERKTDFKA